MSIEVQAKSTSTEVSVTKLWQLPLDIVVQGTTVYVYPMKSSVNPGRIEIDVTAGSLWWDGFETVLHPGAILQFNNELTKQIGVQGTPSFTVIFAVTAKSLLQSGNVDSNIRFHIDSRSGTMIASVPCYALIRVDPSSVWYDRYKYTPPSYTSSAGGGNSGSGIQLKGSLSLVNNATIWMAYYSNDFPITPPQVTTKEIEMPLTLAHEAYNVNVETILTKEGEWTKPVDWDKSTYDPSKAYKDPKTGEYSKGPSKDEAWVSQNHIVESVHVEGGVLKKKTQALPPLKGLPLKDLKYKTDQTDAQSAVKTVQVPDTSLVAKKVVRYGVHPAAATELGEKRTSKLEDEIVAGIARHAPPAESKAPPMVTVAGYHYTDASDLPPLP